MCSSSSDSECDLDVEQGEEVLDICCDIESAPKSGSLICDDTSSSSSSSSSSDESDLAPELWDSDSTDDESFETGSASQWEIVNNFSYILSYFLLFFQLCYHVSDRGLYQVLNFICSIFEWLSAILPGNDLASKISSNFPRTIYSLRKVFGLNSKLLRYCVCPSCHHLYREEDCVVKGPCGTLVSRTCDHVEFPNHPQKKHRAKCGKELLKRIKVGKKWKLVPRKVYVYISVKQSIQQLASRPGFFESCEAWRKQGSIMDGFMTDIYDGKLWKEWKFFLDTPGNLLLMLSVDWFRPFKHTPYSVGVIYVVIQNLPRSLRFKPENIIIVGSIPGPHEPKLTINTYIQPMIEELLQLWKGVRIQNVTSFLGARFIRVALACTSSDIPATRKLCGFYGIKAKHGCSKCMKLFPTTSFSDITDYSGFEREQWPLRDIQSHRQMAYEAKQAATKTAREKLESERGIRFSELLRLPYFDIVRCHVIDPMHNLFLGTAKNITSLWKKNKILSDTVFHAIQEKVDCITVPANVGRIPGKISSAFSEFTAEQWMLWTIVYSPFVLKQYLPSEHYSMWCMFSLACSLLCRPFLHKTELQKADELLLTFCKKFEVLFGKNNVTPNMHLHAHLRQCVEDFGPVFSFWCFSFERYNGILESFQKNWQAPESQLMEKFVLMQTLNGTNVSSSCPPQLMKCVNSVKRNYSLLEDSKRIFDSQTLYSYENNLVSLPSKVNAIKLQYHVIIPPLRENFFHESLRMSLQIMYCKLYSAEGLTVRYVPLRYEEFSQLEVFGQLYTSLKSRSCRSPAVMAIWPSIDGNIVSTTVSRDVRVGLIEYFVLHLPIIDGVSNQPHILAKVKWYQDHPCKSWFKNSILVATTLFDADGAAAFIPVSRIMSRCATIRQTVVFDYGEDTVNVCIPLVRRIIDE